MINLERHIEILLLKNDCVIVPGLGGFITSHIPARYDERDNLFLPPLRTLGFNPKLNINDSLLVQSYAEAYDLSYPDAYTQIESEVNELKQHIDNEGRYELSDIGTLYINNNGNMEFKPCEAGILTPDLYSLSSFEIKKEATQNCSEQEEDVECSYKNNTATTITYATSPVSTRQKENILNKSEISYSNEEGIKHVKFRILKSVFAVIVAIITFFAWTSPINNTNKMIQMGNIDNGIINNLLKRSYNNITKESIRLKHYYSNNSSQSSGYAKAIKTEMTRKETSPHTSKAKDYFCIVLASRVTKNNAENFVHKLNKNGINANTLIEKNNSVKVTYGKYPSKNEAYNALNELRANEYFYDAWVYHVN